MNKKLSDIEIKSLDIEPQAGDILLNWRKNKKSQKVDMKELNTMNKKELLDLVGKGYINIGDAQIEFTITQVAGSDYLHITQKAINEYTTDHEFSGSFVEYLKDEDINQLDAKILANHKKMLEQSEICKKEPLVLTTINGTNKLISNTKKEYLMETLKDHFEIYYCPYSEPEYSINRPLLIDGKLFLPLWSWWLDKGCYMINETK